LIREGRVTVNGRQARIGDSRSLRDHIEVDGKLVASPAATYLMLHKPNRSAAGIRRPWSWTW
jgi:16S rRNA U516 pseudouridylate synthase RsuA-like enzyme